MDSIIQWNCRGFRANLDEIGCMVQDLNPSVFCLQETFLKPPNSFKLRNYHMYNTYGNIAHDRATGGSSILVGWGPSSVVARWASNHWVPGSIPGRAYVGWLFHPSSHCHGPYLS